jgi:hypothetical protein
MVSIQATQIIYSKVLNPSNNKYTIQFIGVALNITSCGTSYTLDSDEFRRLYTQFDFSQYYSFAPNQIVELKNPFGNNGEFSYVNFYLLKCKGSTCKSDDEIDKLMAAYYFSFVYTDYYIDN